MTGPFTRDSGLLVCLDADGGELRIHEQNGRWHAHRWRVSPGDFGDEPRWVGPVAFGLTATEIYDMAEALRRAADAKKTTTAKGKR